jgi:AMP deaminase
MSEEEEDFRQDRDTGDAGSEEYWDEQQDEDNDMLPEAAMMPQDSAETNTSSDNTDGMLPRDIQRKTAYYDYAAEKQLSQADAKLFYQRSQLEAQNAGGSNWGNSQPQLSPQGSPVLLPKSFSNVFEAGQAGIRRSGSINSMKSGHNVAQRLFLPFSPL